MNWLRLVETPLVKSDAQAGVHRSASVTRGRLDTLLSIGPASDEPGLAWAIELLAQERIDPAMRRYILAGRGAGREQGQQEPLVCSCFGVRQAEFADAVRQGSQNVDAVGRASRAGTNCGSCRPEIHKIVEAIKGEPQLPALAGEAAQ